MKKVSKKLIISVLLALSLTLLLATVLVACDGNDALPYKYLVTFKYNLNDEMSSVKPDDQYLGIKDDNSLVSIRPGYDPDRFPERAVRGYYVENWYEAEINENGEPIVENGLVKLKPEPWDFAHDRVTGDITLYANMKKAPVLHYKEIIDGVEHEVSQYIATKPGYTLRKPSTAATQPQKTGWTFMGKYYTDSTFTEEFKWTHMVGGNEREGYQFGEEDIDVYVQFIEGIWTLVSTPNQLTIAMSNSQNIYLMNDITFDEEQDAAGNYKSNWTPQYFNAWFNGNGHTVSNLHVVKSIHRNSYENFGLFGQIDARAEIYDVTFANCTASFAYINDVSGLVSVGFFAWKIEDGAKIKNVTINGGSLSVDFGKLATQNKLEVYDFIGGLTPEREAQFKDKGNNWTVSGVTVTKSNIKE